MTPIISKTSPAVSPPSGRHALADAKISVDLTDKKCSSSTVGGWFTSAGLAQLYPNRQKERKGKQKVECHLCGKFLSNKRGLVCHIRVVHSKPSMTNAKSESSQKLPSSDQQVNNNDSDMGSSKPEMEVSKDPQNVNNKNFSTRETPTKGMATLRRGGNEKCAVIFVFGKKKLKLTSLVIQMYRVFLLTGTPLKVLSIRFHSKSHQKVSEFTYRLALLGGSQ